MADDRTKPHPLYALVGPSLLGSWSLGIICKEPQDWPPSKAIATERSWLHADALRREGYMMALKVLRERWWGSPDLLEDIVAILVDEAPGETATGPRTPR